MQPIPPQPHDLGSSAGAAGTPPQEFIKLEPLAMQQLVTLVKKRVINGKRYWGTTFCQITCPILYLLIIIVVTKISLLVKSGNYSTIVINGITSRNAIDSK